MGGYKFYTYYDLKDVGKDEEIDLASWDSPLIKDSMYHSISGNDQNILIGLK